MNNLENLLVFLAIGLIAGWLAGVLVKGRGFGVLGDIVVGVIGAVLGGWIFGKLGLFADGFAGAIFTAFIGAVALLTVIKLLVNVSAKGASAAVLLLLATCGIAQAATTVTVDDNNKVTVTPGIASAAATTPVVYTTAVPVVVAQEVVVGDFQGRIVEIDYSRNQILVQYADGRNRQFAVRPEEVNAYRIGDYVQVRPSNDLTIVTLQENPRDFEGEIIRVDMTKSQILVLDTNGRERRVQLKQGMISTYKVDDYVRVHLMADLREAKTIETIRDIRSLEGDVVRMDAPASRLIVRDRGGNERTVVVRQGMVTSYRVGHKVRVYQFADRQDVQLVRILN